MTETIKTMSERLDLRMLLQKFRDEGARQIRVGFDRPDNFLGRLICRITKSEFSHTYLIFVVGLDRDEMRIEARAGVGVVKMHVEAPAEGAVEITLTTNPQLATEKFLIAQTWVGAATYSVWQLLAIWMCIGWGWKVPARMGSVVCSELVARVCYPQFDLRNGKTFDECSPQDVLEAAERNHE
jgi:hypothetical protein